MDARAQQIYDYMLEYQQSSAVESIPPTFNEIVEYLGLSGRGSVVDAMQRLVDSGWVEELSRSSRKYRAIPRG